MILEFTIELAVKTTNLSELRYVFENYLTKGKTLRNAIAILLLGSSALCLILTGCGSSGGDQLDKEGYVAKADAICKEASRKLSLEVTSAVARVQSKPGEQDKTKVQTTLVKTVLVPGLEAELQELRALGMPSEGEPEVQAFLTASQKVIDSAKTAPQAFGEASNGYEPAELAGRRYGISSCPITSPEAQ